MAKKRRNRADRDGIRFLALPHTVLNSIAFLNLSGPAVRLLLDIGLQYSGANNGKLVACMKYLAPRRWTSNDTVQRARRELEAAGFLCQTRKGGRPNRAAWFAVTWVGLDWLPEMDIAKASFERGLYGKNDPLPAIMKTHPLSKNTRVIPSDGVASAVIDPPDGVESYPPTPPDGAMQAHFSTLSTPPDGDYIDIAICEGSIATAPVQQEAATASIGRQSRDADSSPPEETESIYVSDLQDARLWDEELGDFRQPPPLERRH